MPDTTTKTNAPAKFRFCKDCHWCFKPPIWGESTCTHPEENYENSKYLSTGQAEDAEKTEYSRMSSSACGPSGSLFEPR